MHLQFSKDVEDPSHVNAKSHAQIWENVPQSEISKYRRGLERLASVVVYSVYDVVRVGTNNPI